MSGKQAPSVVVLLLLASALFVEGSGTGDPAQIASGVRLPLRTPRRPRIAAPGPLCVKVYWDGDNAPDYMGAVTADITLVNDFAVKHNQQGLVFNGTVDSRHIEAELSAGSIDILLTCTWNYWSGVSTVFSPAVQAALETALANGKLKKLMVWHAWNAAGIDNRVPGLSADGGCTDYWSYINPMYPNADLYSHAGPTGALTQSIPGAGDEAALGYCDRATVTSSHRNATMHTWGPDENDVTAFSFCEGQGVVFYSSIPIDYYWSINRCGEYSDICRFHANAMYAFIYNIKCIDPPTCPPSPVLSASWLPPNNKMTRLSLAAVPTFDPDSPGIITITGVQYFDSTTGQQPVLPLAQWSSSGAADKAWVSIKAQRNGAGKGRLYRIQYTASNEVGSCSDVTYVCVPHDASAFDPLTQEERNASLSAHAGAAAVVKHKVGCPDPAGIHHWMSTTNV